jgi:hypothetical protein
MPELKKGGWRNLLLTVVAMLAAIALGLLFIPQLSMRAAVRGGAIAIGVVLVSRLIMWLYVRSKSPR